MTVDWPDWQPHPHMATAQYAQGVPIARKPTGIFDNNGNLAASGSTTLFSNHTIDQPSFQFVVFLQYGAGAPVLPFARIQLVWTDSASGFQVGSDQFILPVGQAAASEFLITGNSRMDELTANLFNLDTVLPLQWTIGVSQTSHVYDKIRLQEIGAPQIPTFTRDSASPAVGILSSSIASIGANSHRDVLATAWSGLAQLSVDNEGNANPITVKIIDPGQSTANTHIMGTTGEGVLAVTTVQAGQTGFVQVILPYGAVVIRGVNSSAAAFGPAITLSRLDQ